VGVKEDTDRLVRDLMIKNLELAKRAAAVESAATERRDLAASLSAANARLQGLKSTSAQAAATAAAQTAELAAVRARKTSLQQLAAAYEESVQALQNDVAALEDALAAARDAAAAKARAWTIDRKALEQARSRN